MADESLRPEERSTIDTIARYQFGLGGDSQWLPDRPLTVLRSRSGRIDRVFDGDDRLCTLTTHGRLTLGFAGGERLRSMTAPPAGRVVMDEEASPFVAEGRNAFAKFVVEVDPRIRPRDEVVVVDQTDTPIAVGRAELAAKAMTAFDRGMAVSVRTGVDEHR